MVANLDDQRARGGWRGRNKPGVFSSAVSTLSTDLAQIDRVRNLVSSLEATSGSAADPSQKCFGPLAEWDHAARQHLLRRLRALVSSVAETCLREQPRTLRGVRQALSRPERFEAANVFFLDTRTNVGVRSLPLAQAFDRHPVLESAAHHLALFGVYTFAQLIDYSPGGLTALGLSQRQIEHLDRACAAGDLSLKCNAERQADEELNQCQSA